MLTYLINVSLTWIILFVIYKALLEKEKYFTMNRVYLMSSLTLGLLLPLISYIPVEETKLLPVITSQINEVYQSQIIAMEAYVSPVISSTQSTTETSSFNWMLMFQLIYFLGLAFAMFRLIKSSSKLFRLLSKSQTNKKSSHSEIVVSENILPFSFMKYIFIGNQDYNSGERNNILRHELYHVQSVHSIDILFVELLKIIFWRHPMLYLYKRAVAENHEYSADQAVLSQSSRKQYCELLMKATFPGVILELTNPFFKLSSKSVSQ
jgi:bla regulator protein BlaR1